ncbi:MCE family protein [Nocardioides rubriscoriae]|uniref:MCE family protein n=1 Tax=Nocardioides rubriscoriae TaxID=642762 RepID=UPI001FEB3AB5|nr:MCE family protein [Nocardioides rubriscoriae]
MPLLVNIHHDTAREHRRLLVAGIAFLTSMALLVALSIAIYDKKFVDVTTVVIRADRAGLQLATFGDVRRHGVLIGQVRSVSEVDGEAEIEVALDPAAARDIPDNATVQILPTTLFGQKFVSFVDPATPSPTALAPGAVIPSSRVETNVELSRILADLFPLLRAVRPADLNATLNALSDALEGRGDQLGGTLDDLDRYLTGIQGSLPTLKQDLGLIADVADTYDLAAPDLLRVLGNLTVTSRTVLQKKQSLDVFFGDLTGLADTSRTILAANESDLIEVGEVGAPVLKLLATYSPELPCLLKGAARYAPILSRTFEGNQVKQYIEIGSAQYGAYTRDDLPKYGEIGHGPWCSGLPYPPVPIGPVRFDDGTDIDDDPPTSDVPVLPLPRSAPGWTRRSGFGVGMSSGYAGTAGEQQVVNALLSDRTGRPADAYGSLGSLLYGPVVRGGAR